MNKAYLMTLFELAEKDRNVLLLLADSGTSFDELFKKELPEQILDFGIAEENMVASAAGMASCGKIPFLYTASAFLSYRSYEFIRDDVCLQNRNVKFIGMGTGLSWSTLGPTHHTTEELALLRALPNLVVLTPSTPSMTIECVRYAYKHKGPVYIRIGMGGEPEIYNDFHRNLDKYNIVKDGKDIAIFSTGSIINNVLMAVKRIENENNLSIKVVDICKISPIDETQILDILKDIQFAVTIEEHNIIGGLGSAISEIIAKNHLKIRLEKIGLEGFATGYGTLDEVRIQNGLGADEIYNKILKLSEAKYDR